MPETKTLVFLSDEFMPSVRVGRLYGVVERPEGPTLHPMRRGPAWRVTNILRGAITVEWQNALVPRSAAAERGVEFEGQALPGLERLTQLEPPGPNGWTQVTQRSVQFDEFLSTYTAEYIRSMQANILRGFNSLMYGVGE
jgi:hypothetical protein